MSLRVRVVLVVIVGLSLGACSQADGPMPTPSEDVQEELVDVRRDLQNIASARDPRARQDLADDLRKYSEVPEASSAVDELSQQAAAVLVGADLSDETAQQLAHSLWLSVAAVELSERQMEALQSDVVSLLMTEGIAEEDAQQVAAQIGEVQGAVATRPRRWYELF